ncbi:MAG: FkbM family methyltransferase [Opitutales bacterium]|nr:FkbM family methyltransferase [Opitutales bacterium]
MKYRLTRATKKKQLEHLLKLLKPFATEHQLIRLGGNSDGGYLIPNDLMGIDQCFSPGVDVTSNFELACAERGMEVFLADCTVESPPIQHQNFRFVKKHVGGYARNQFIDFSTWIKENGKPESDLLLQMDIEGHEYEVLFSASSQTLEKFRIIAIEFHSLDRLSERSYYDLALPIFEKLRQSHICVHIHPNNYDALRSNHGISIPKFAEFTFLRRDRVKKMEVAKTFPHPLDRDCCDKKPVLLPKCWYST